MSQPSISLITNEVIHSVNSALFVSFLKDGYDKMLNMQTNTEISFAKNSQCYKLYFLQFVE